MATERTFTQIYDLYYGGGALDQSLVLSQMSPAQRAVWSIIDDLSDRRGLRHEWDRIDDEIKDEIFKVWTALIEKER